MTKGQIDEYTLRRSLSQQPKDVRMYFVLNFWDPFLFKGFSIDDTNRLKKMIIT